MCTIAAKRYAAAQAAMASSSSSNATARATKRRRLDDGVGGGRNALVATPPANLQPSSSSPSRKRRRVGFAPSPRVVEVPRWTPQEHRASWYGGVDIALFKLQEQADAATLRAMMSVASSVAHLPQDTSIYRGLERLLSPQIAAEIRDRRKVTVKSVLTEQELQRAQGVKDEARLAAASQCCSEKAEAWARTLGGLP